MLTTVQPLCAAEHPDPKIHPQHRQGHFWVLWKGQLRYHPQQLRVHIHHHHRQGPFLGHHMVHPAPPEVQTPFLRDPPPNWHQQFQQPLLGVQHHHHFLGLLGFQRIWRFHYPQKPEQVQWQPRHI